ncbi:MAG: WYL domain-containing protein [Terrimicrobiaceae bacterium]
MMKIHELLAAGEFPNCSNLAGVFEVSYKTVQRDIDFMRDQLLLPIDYDMGRHGFHYTKPVNRFPMMTVSQGELVALLVAQKAVEQYRGTSFEAPLRSAFEKLASSLDSETSISLHELSDAVSFRPSGVPVSELKVYEKLAEAVLKSEVLEFDYLGLHASKPGRRRVEPLHLSCIADQWYLIANDQVRAAKRTFALTRVRKVKNLKRTFRKPADFSLTQMLEDSFSAFEARDPVRVKIRFSPFAARIVSERKWHKSQKLAPTPEGGAVLTMQVGLAPDLEKWILGWADSAEVLEPASLREKVGLRAAKMAGLYR